jgi:hypothetical protein
MEFKNKMTKVQCDNNKLLEENKELKKYPLYPLYTDTSIIDIINEMNGVFTFYERGFNSIMLDYNGDS